MLGLLVVCSVVHATDMTVAVVVVVRLLNTKR